MAGAASRRKGERADEAALAAVRRPRLAEDFIGHEDQARQLLQALRAGRVGHAWLFAGERALGKATLAFAFARALLAHEGTAAPEGGSLFGPQDGADEAAGGDAGAALWALGADEGLIRRLAEGTEPRALVIDPAEIAIREGGRASQQIRVDDVRRIQQFLQMRAAPGERRVILVDDADRMTPAAANAILKMLEEPPADVVFLLVAHRLHRLPATIRSRCRLLRFEPLAAERLVPWLAARVPDGDEEDRLAAAALAGGAPGRALRLLEGDLVARYRRLVAVLAQPLEDEKTFRERASAIAAVTECAEEDRALLLDLLRSLPLRLARALAAGGEAGARLIDEERAAARRLAPRGAEAVFAFRDLLATRLDEAERLYLDLKAVLWTLVARFDALAAR